MWEPPSYSSFAWLVLCSGPKGVWVGQYRFVVVLFCLWLAGYSWRKVNLREGGGGHTQLCGGLSEWENES